LRSAPQDPPGGHESTAEAGQAIAAQAFRVLVEVVLQGRSPKDRASSIGGGGAAPVACACRSWPMSVSAAALVASSAAVMAASAPIRPGPFGKAWRDTASGASCASRALITAVSEGAPPIALVSLLRR